MSRFIPVDRQTSYLFPPSVEDWLPENHLARFIVEVVERLDLSALTRQYAGRGSAAHHPAVLLGLLIYGYATGLPSSRKIERATYDSVALRYIAANTHPDHDTLAAFRRRCGEQFEQLFVQVLMLARELGMLKLGKIAVDGSKLKANASRHSALSWGHIKKIEAQLRQEVKQLMALAESEDRKQMPDGMDVPQEIARRQERLAALDEAKRKLEERALERDAQAQAEYEAKVAKRQAKRDSGKKPGGKDPEPPSAGGVQDKDQINLTDEESRIMKVGGGFDQCYNAKAAVDADSMLIVGSFVTQAGNDSQQIKPMLQVLVRRQKQLGQIGQVLADTGYFSAANVAACEDAGIVPMIAIKREQHHPPMLDRFTEAPQLSADATAVEAMAHRLKTKTGRADYALRKQSVEPVFGIIKHVMKFRQFLVRGRQKVAHEWNLVALAWNLKRMNVLNMA
jgi:transposase/IS5 family transposase